MLLVRFLRLRHCYRLALLLLAGLSGGAGAYGQAPDFSALARRFAGYQQKAVPEKLFLHLDRPLYLSGETLWFKAYTVDGTYNRPLAMSSVAYVEVLDARNTPVLQTKIALAQATGHGSFLLPASMPSGTYQVRAYTSWMKNFGAESFYQQAVTVVNTFTTAGAQAAKDSVAYDVQFYPEGGNLVAGLSSKVAFKAVNAVGQSVAVEGRVLNQQNKPVATFRTLRHGMGSFMLTPEVGATYKAIVTVRNGPTISRDLPRAFPQGVVMRLERTASRQLTIAVQSTQKQPEAVFLLAHARQQVVVAAQSQLIDGQATFTVDAQQLLPGVSHFTVFGANQQPLCERLFFQPPPPPLAITAVADQQAYPTRGNVRIAVATPGATDSRANLSMAVYRLDSLSAKPGPDIHSYLQLTADLRGRVENPEYYLQSTAPDLPEATDNLMLTQGWSRFKWEQALAATPPVFTYLPELHGPVVEGRVLHPVSGQPVAGITTYLSSPSLIVQLNNAVSDARGRVRFEMNDLYGPRDLIMQTNPAQDSTCRLEILPAFASQYTPAFPMAAAPALRLQPSYAARHLQAQLQTQYFGKYRNRYTPLRPDSAAFYGSPDETYLLDKYTRFKVMEEVMREYVPGVIVRIRKDGFHFLVIDKVNQTVLDENPMVLLDGVPVFNINKIMAMNPLSIRKLDVMDARYFHGSAIYDGVVSFSTYKGDLEGFKLDPRVLVQQYEGLQAQREFYAPRYETAEARQSRLPDLRNLLYWNPAITTTGPTASTVDFYTGDQPGRYLVVVQGLASTGQAGSTSFVLEVKGAL
ncbi:MG2 domain-containing protein [Hymenobacter sp. APR13]|uniref:MG2 domain-containing protein n=1 Tax=Hymenobacter sp. APR13 TaxID=1356852 RepID=UPI0004E059E6|nr:MG2 domain-containing protein [Hymenobacter sp. APR13]AII51706.1 hypothetical protein N008_06870 [Hymenobacter sp. APR13]